MPARREWTAEELAARLAKEREQGRLRVARHRAKHKVTVTEIGNGNAVNAVTVTSPSLHARGDGRSPAPVTTITEDAVLRTACAPDAALTDAERIALLLQPYAARGYVHKPASWARLLGGLPAGVDPVLEVLRACEWLDEPAHRERPCTFRFLSGWIKRAAPPPPVAAAAPQARTAPATSGSRRPTSAFARVLSVISEAADADE